MKQERDIEIRRLRPVIPGIATEDAVNPAEQFQNATLRPVLKLQNDLLISIYRQYILKRKGVFHQLSRPKKTAWIQQSINKDQGFRNLLTGVVAGHFTMEEWAIFTIHEAEIRRRIGDLLVQRICDQLDQL